MEDLTIEDYKVLLEQKELQLSEVEWERDELKRDAVTQEATALSNQFEIDRRSEVESYFTRKLQETKQRAEKAEAEKEAIWQRCIEIAHDERSTDCIGCVDILNAILAEKEKL